MGLILLPFLALSIRIAFIYFILYFYVFLDNYIYFTLHFNS